MAPRTLTVRLASGLRFTCFAADRGLGRAMARDAFERAELACAIRHVKAGDVAIDGGAHLGAYTLRLAQQVGPSGRVYAFEPHPETCALLAATVASNGFEGRITVRAAAVADVSGPGALLSARRCSAHAHARLAAPGARTGPGERLFPTDIVALDDLSVERRVAFIKLDVEGAELLAIRGARRLIRRDRPAILCELADAQSRLVSGASSDGVLGALGDAGYTAREIRPDGSAGARLESPPTARTSTVLFLPEN